MRAPAIIRSGWWVAFAGGAVSLGIIMAVLSSTGGLRAPAAERDDFDLEALGDRSATLVRAMARDGLRALTEPNVLDPSDIPRLNEEGRGKILVGSDRIIGVEIADQARAYPLRLMRWHEVVNDAVGGEPIVVTYSPLCDSTAVYSRRVDGAIADFGVSGLLYQSNPLLYDRNLGPPSSPLWVQLTGRPAFDGAAKSALRLQVLPASTVTWNEWLDRHPKTTVMAGEDDLKKLYKRDPYHSYFGSDVLRFPVDPHPPDDGLRLKDRVVAITVDGEDRVFGLTDLAEAAGATRGAVDVEVADLALRLHFDAEIGTVSADPVSDPSRLEGLRLSFWFAWYALEGTIPANIHGAETTATIQIPVDD